MGRWQPVGLTEGLWREVAAPPPSPAATVPLPIASRQGGSCHRRHPGLDPGSMTSAPQWIPDQVRMTKVGNDSSPPQSRRSCDNGKDDRTGRGVAASNATALDRKGAKGRSEEKKSELQSLMRISY